MPLVGVSAMHDPEDENKGPLGAGEREPTVVDVYDWAGDIGKEFERIIDSFGADAVTGIMPKVINVLEQLERLATKNEREDTAMQELRQAVHQLEHEKHEKAIERQRFETELEQIEDHWRKESEDLVSVVSRLQDENRKLSSSLREKEGPFNEMSPSSEVDVALVQRLKGTIGKQREQLRHVERELSSKASEFENIQSQVERLTVVNKELRRKHKQAQSQVRVMVDERADLQAYLQDHQRELGHLRQQLGVAQKENEDLMRGKTESPELRNKVVYDMDDPNRPRFTTSELKDILHERNELKARVSDLEDELDLYRPRSTQGASVDEEEEPAVQGPLPLEPDDAPWKRSESGIRKLFRKLFGERGPAGISGIVGEGVGDRGGGSPKRTLTLLPKMSFGLPSPTP